MGEAIHNEKWPVVEKAAAVGYGSTLFTMPSGVASATHCPVRSSRTSTNFKRGRGWRPP